MAVTKANDGLLTNVNYQRTDPYGYTILATDRKGDTYHVQNERLCAILHAFRYDTKEQ